MRKLAMHIAGEKFANEQSMCARKFMALAPRRPVKALKKWSEVYRAGRGLLSRDGFEGCKGCRSCVLVENVGFKLLP